MADSSTRRPRAVILTALPIEYRAVRSHLSNLHEETHTRGTIYECGIFTSEKQTWDVGIVEVSAGNSRTAVEAERAITYFQPELMFFVGVAGGLKDVTLGDVVVATKVYGYESGKANRSFMPRPEVGESSYELENRARAEGRKRDWLQRLGRPIPDPAPRVFIAPIAAGDKVVSSRRSTIFRLLTANYSDALAVEMEGQGFLQVAHANQQVLALIIRGISDLIDDKVVADAANTQELAACHASAFAFEVLAKFDREPDREKIFIDFTQTQREKKSKFEDKLEKPLDENGEDIKLNKNAKDTSDDINDTLNEERENVTFSPESESKYEITQLPVTEEEFTEWYYKLGDYEQYFVLTTAVLHGAPVREVVKHTDSLYQFVHLEVERHGNLLWSVSHSNDLWETQQKDNIRFSDPLLRTISARDLHKITYTEPRKVRGVERLYWQDADAHGISIFGLRLLEFLCREFNSRGELGQFFLNALQQWSNETIGEVSRKATHSYGVIMWSHDVIELQKMAEKWAIEENNPRRTAELLDGAYEINRVKSIEKSIEIETSSDVLDLLKKWVKGVHKALMTEKDKFSEEELEDQSDKKESLLETGQKGNENQADREQTEREIDKPEDAVKLGRAIARTYALIGKGSPDIALKGLGRLLKLPRSNYRISIEAISEAVVSTYVMLIWSGHVRDVLEHLAANAEQLSHSQNRPLESKKRHEYRYQRKIYLNATLEAFFRIAKESLTDLQKIRNIQYNLSEPLSPQPIIPDPAGRDVLLAFLLSASEVRCQGYITKLLCASILETESKLAFSLLRYWAEIVLQMRASQVSDAEEMYVIFRQFIVYLGKTVEKWCFDLKQQKLFSPPAFETFKKRLKQWRIEGNFYTHPIGSLAEEVLQQLGN